MKCLICKKSITSAESIARGVGPECAGKYAAFIAAAGSSVERMEVLAGLNDAEVSRWLHYVNQAVRAGNRRDARAFLQAAEQAAKAAPFPALVLPQTAAACSREINAVISIGG